MVCMGTVLFPFFLVGLIQYCLFVSKKKFLLLFKTLNGLALMQCLDECY